MSEQPPNSPMPRDLLAERGLPSDERSEKMCLGAIQVNGVLFENVASIVQPGDFSLEKNKRVFVAMTAIHERSEPIDRITVATELQNTGKLESIGGLTYLLELDEGMPAISHPETYAKSVAEKSRLRQLIFTAQKTIDRALRQDTAAAEIAEQASNQIVSIGAQGIGDDDGGETPTEVIEGYPGGISAFLDSSLRVRGLPTGFVGFDEMTGGLTGGQMVIIAARPGHGKTSIALNISEHLVLNSSLRKSVAFFSLEMANSQLLTRMACSHGRINSHSFRLGYLNKEERHRLQLAVSDITEAPMRFYDAGGMTMPDISRRMRRLVKEEQLKLGIIDYLGLIASHGRSENKNQEVSLISRQSKLLARELDIPILMLCQLSRLTERRGDPRPLLSDLRDSGCLSVATTKLFNPNGIWPPGHESQTSSFDNYKVIGTDSRYLNTGIRDLVRVTTKAGRFVDCTPDHKILTDAGYVEAGLLTTAHSIASIRTIPEPNEVKYIREAKLIGWMLGNGSMRGYSSPSFICSCPVVAQEFCATVKRFWGLTPRPHPHKCKAVSQYDITAGPVRTSAGNPVKDWFMEHDLWGRINYQKRIPDWFIKDADNASLAEIVSGLWETDGTVTRRVLKFATTSYEMAWQVIWMLNRLGIFSYIDTGYKSKKANHPVFTVLVAGWDDVLRFKYAIPLIGRKKERLDAIPDMVDGGSNHGDRVGVWVGEEIKKAKDAARSSWSKLGYTVQGKRISQKDLKRVMLKLPDGLGHLKHLISDDIYWDRFESRQDIGTGEVFDRCVVGGPHNFVANGIIVHNSLEQDADIVAFVFREELHRADREDLRGVAELIVSKQRDGPIGRIPLRFLKQFTKFENLSSGVSDGS